MAGLSGKKLRTDKRSSLSIKRKILIYFISAIIIAGCTSIYPLLGYKDPIQKYDSVLENITLANNISSICKDFNTVARELMIDLNKDDLRTEYNNKLEVLNSTLRQLENGLVSEASLASANTIKSYLETYIENSNNATDASSAFDTAERIEIIDYAKKVSEYIDTSVKELISSEIEYSKILRQGLDKTTSTILTATIIILGLVLAICVLLAYLLASGISNPLRKISKQADSIAFGDLTVEKVIVKTKDELGVLSASFNKMLINLREMITKVNSSSTRILEISDQLNQSTDGSTAASEQISVAIQEIADGSQNQVVLSENTASTIDGIYEIVSTISKKSANAKLSSDEAQKVTDEGNKCIGKVIDQMSSINSTIEESAHISEEFNNKSKEIGQIVAAITSIAEQTNLLALNAAIEAARAGDQGKGFAVVADEVRKLAEQSSDAAKQINSIINSIQTENEKMSNSMVKSINEIKAGILVTNSAGEAFQKISSTIGKVDEDINEIYSEISDINEAVQEIKESGDRIVDITKSSSDKTQDVAASIEEMSAGMQEVLSTTSVLKDMAFQLQQLVDGFKL
jgi:methyl-accepting chemotaxis protein